MRIRLVRWSGLLPLLGFLALVGIGWLLFGDFIVEQTSEEASTELLGTQVDIASLHIRETQSAVDIGGLEIADPFNPMRNLIEARGIRLALEPEPLLEKKLVIRRLSLEDLRFGTTRRKAARPVKGGGFAPQTLRALNEWREQFDVPLLSLTPIDTIKAIVLDPSQLSTVSATEALQARADSTKQALEAQWAAVNIAGVVDSANATAKRLEGVTTTQLGLDGTRRAVADVQRAIALVDGTEKQVRALSDGVQRGVRGLAEGVASVNEARQRDYAFVRGLMKLPSLEGPAIGGAFFGQVSIDRFQRAVYWAELAQKYLPPGLRPQAQAGPKRLRMDGTTVRFPREKHWPPFLLQSGDLSFSLASGAVKGAYALEVRNVTTTPALLGRPTTFVASRTAPGTSLPLIDVQGSLDHTRATPRDQVRAALARVPLPAFDLPGLPFRVEPGAGSMRFDFTLEGRDVNARWNIRSTEVRWPVDSARTRALTDMESLVGRVLQGLGTLEVDARLTGPLAHPRLSVHSNLDDAVAARLRGLVGEAVAAGERMARAKVDSVVNARVQPVLAQVGTITAEAERRVPVAEGQLGQVKAVLEERLRTLTAGLGGQLKLPGLP
jgi:uncharacterized protein (TIGR03545 family)